MRLVALLLALLLPSPAAPLAHDGEWRWPVEGPRLVLAGYRIGPDPWDPGHRGVDLAAAPGAAVLAPADAVVHFAGRVVDRPVLSLDLADGALVSLEPVTTTLAEGEAVLAGEPIGTVQAGHCAEGCVHLGVRVGGEYRNPLLWLGGVPRAVLLPTRAAAVG